MEAQFNKDHTNQKEKAAMITMISFYNSFIRKSSNTFE